jgi:hypothetical protein
MEGKDKGEGPMPNILMLNAAVFARSSWPIGSIPFQGLNTSFLIVGNHELARFRQGRGTGIQVIDGLAFVRKGFILGRVLPVATQMGSN